MILSLTDKLLLGLLNLGLFVTIIIVAFRMLKPIKIISCPRCGHEWWE